MTQVLDDANGHVATQPAAKPAWTAPVIETYDVAEFTLAQGTRFFDQGGGNLS